jgi:hypothetical protein
MRRPMDSENEVQTRIRRRSCHHPFSILDAYLIFRLHNDNRSFRTVVHDGVLAKQRLGRCIGRHGHGAKGIYICFKRQSHLVLLLLT